MKKTILSETAIYTGTIDSPKGYEIDREKIKKEAVQGYVLNNRKHFIENTWEHKDYKLMRYIPELRFVEDYIRDFFKIKAGLVLEPKDYYVNILEHLEQSYSRNNLNLNHLLDSSNYTMIYCVDVTEKSSSIVIEYDDHLRINKLHQVPIKNNKFIIMPSTLRYFISENLSEDPNIFINITYRAR
jgi:hypothetical protein|tara:strand:- start:5075 stop:5629 length:555 start_codon:yes stop_codon:yes gene_type:complete